MLKQELFTSKPSAKEEKGKENITNKYNLAEFEQWLNEDESRKGGINEESWTTLINNWRRCNTFEYFINKEESFFQPEQTKQKHRIVHKWLTEKEPK